MNTTTSHRAGRVARAVAFASTAVVIFAAAACGTETDGGSPAAPAPAPAAEPHAPMSADAAERLGASERQAAANLEEQYLQQLRSAAEKTHVLKLRRSHMHSPNERGIPMP
jgi:hypothetical protein